MKPDSLSGFRDFLPEQAIARQKMFGVVRSVFERFGFAPIDTPAVERIGTLEGKYGDEGDSLIFRIAKRGRDLQRALTDINAGANPKVLSETALRYDLTVPLARLVAQYTETIPLPFKRFHIAPVWRAEGAQKGRFREFYQCDVDTVGSSSMMADAEIIQMIEATLTGLGFERFTIRVNNRKILDAMLVAAGIPAELHIPALRVLDKLEKVGRDDVQSEMESRLGITMERSGRLLELVDGVTSQGMGALRGLIDEVGLDELAHTLELVGLLVNDPGRIVFDPSVARGLDYYTGNVYETCLLDSPDIGSVMSGGRYDGLVGMFLGRDVPAVGVSLGVDRLFSAMEDLGLVDTSTKTSADYMIAVMGEAQLPYAMRVARMLREKGYNVYFYPDLAEMRKQLGQANALGIPMVAIIGEDEMATETVAVRDMRSRKQEVVSLVELV